MGEGRRLLLSTSCPAIGSCSADGRLPRLRLCHLQDYFQSLSGRSVFEGFLW